MNTEIQALREELQQLKQQCRQAMQSNANLSAHCQQAESRYQQSECRYHHAERRFRVLGGLALVAVVGAILVSPSNRAVLAQGYGTTLQQLLARMKVIENKTQFMSSEATAKTTTFTGCNVFIQNGLGATNGYPADPATTDPSLIQTNGLGNLIIGYNASRTLFGATDTRTGSHNIIAGDFQNHSSFGGLVVGRFNTISGVYASVSGGDSNTASGNHSSVSGGSSNTARGTDSSVSGGFLNNAGAFTSSVSGGFLNNAAGFSSSIGGGQFNTAGDPLNPVSGTVSSISGGNGNKAVGYASSVSGGLFIKQSNLNGWSAGGDGGQGVFHSP